MLTVKTLLLLIVVNLKIGKHHPMCAFRFQNHFGYTAFRIIPFNFVFCGGIRVLKSKGVFRTQHFIVI